MALEAGRDPVQARRIPGTIRVARRKQVRIGSLRLGGDAEPEDKDQRREGGGEFRKMQGAHRLHYRSLQLIFPAGRGIARLTAIRAAAAHRADGKIASRATSVAPRKGSSWHRARARRESAS